MAENKQTVESFTISPSIVCLYTVLLQYSHQSDCLAAYHSPDHNTCMSIDKPYYGNSVPDIPNRAMFPSLCKS